MAETALPEIPDGFRLMGSPAVPEDKALPAIPEGFKLIQGGRTEQPRDLPPIPEGFKLAGAPVEAAKPVEEGIVDKIGQPITDPKQAEDMAKAQGTGALDYVKNIGAGMGERVLDLFGGFGDLLAATAPGPDSGIKYPYGSGNVQADLQKASQEMHDTSLGYKPGTTWEDVKKSPASNFVAFAVEQGLVSAPDMAAAVAALPAYIAARTGELADERAQNNAAENATVDDLLATMPAAVATALLDRLGARSMFGLNEAVTQGLKQVPKEVAKSAVKEGATEAAQEGIEDVATTAGTKKGWQPADTAERMLAASLAGGFTGAAVRTGTSTLEAATNTDTPVEGDQGETVEPETPPLQVPVTQDGGEEVASPLPSSSPSATPEERAILRRTSMPDEDIDAMSPEERAAKVEEARAAGIRVNGAMVRAAEQYQAPQPEALPENGPIPAQRPQETVESVSPVEAPAQAEMPVPAPVSQPEPELATDTQQQLADTVRQSVEADQTQQVEQAVQPVMPQLQQAVQQSVAADQDTQAEQAIATVQPQLAQTVQQSVAEDMRGDGSRQAPAYINAPEHIDVAAQRVNTEPTDAQKEAGNYQKGHIKVGGLDITIENPKGSTRTGTSPNGQQWSVQMPATYGYIKRSSGADGDQVDVYVGDNPASKRVYVVDQRDPVTRKFDEHKALMGVSSVSEARDLYARAFSDRSGTDRIGAVTPMSVSEFKAWLREGDTTKPLRMGKGVRLNEAGFPVDLKGGVKKPDSLIEFLARKGGVREDRGELTTLGLRDRKTGFVTGAGPLIRQNGMHPDKAREAAAEAGYLPMESSLADFYDALDMDARSGRQQFSEYDQDWSAAWREGQGGEQRAAEEDAALSTEQEVRDQLAAYGFPVEKSERFVSAVAREMDAGLPFEEAVESAYSQLARDALADQPSASVSDIPFFGDDLEVQSGTAPQRGETDRAVGERGARAEEVRTEGTGDDRPVRGEGRTEAEGNGSREDGGRSDREGESPRPRAVGDKRSVASSTDFSGTIDITHGYDGPDRPQFVKDFKGDRYDGNTFGDDGVYLDHTGIWTSPSAESRFVRENVAKGKVRFRKALVLSPDTIETILAKIPRPDRPELDSNRHLYVGEDITKFARQNGHDGIVVTGFDKLNDSYEAEQRLVSRFGAHESLMQDQVFAFDPEAVKFEDEPLQANFSINPITGSQSFKKWFAGSKAVNADGTPLVVYHGTNQAFESFDKETRGEHTQDLDAKEAFFFTESPTIAAQYATLRPKVGKPQTVPVYLSIKNPWVHDMKGKNYDANVFAKWLRYAKQNGRDGVIFRNVNDDVNSIGGELSNTYAVFEPTQIKSVNNRGTFDPSDPRISYSDAPVGWDFADAGEPMPKLSEAEQKRLVEIVSRTAGIDPSFVDSIKVPKGTKALEAWGKGDEEMSTASGFYSPMRDIITLALDTAPVRAGKVAYHEAFHRLQNLFLKDVERKLLKANDARLRKMIAEKGEYSQATVDRMSRKEVEAEAFGIWADRQDNAGLHIGIRKVWKSIKDMLARVRNYLNGRGYQTVEDVFGKAKSGEMAKRAKQEPKTADKEFSIVDRAPDQPLKPKTSVPTAPKPKTGFADRLAAVSKSMAAKAKSKGGRYDRMTEDDGETFADYSTRKVLDYLDPVLKMQQKVGVDLNDLSDAYLTARLAEGTIRHELHQVDEKYVQPAIKELAAVGATEKDLHEYLYAMHAPERNLVVGLRNEPDSDLYKAATDPSISGASGMSTNEAKEMLRDLAKDREKFIGIRRAASHIRAMLDDGLKRQLRAGLINKATYDELTQQWQHYVPLRAESDQDGTGGGMPSKSRGFDVRGDEFKGATGRYTKADNVIVYAINNAEQSIIRAEKNKAATAALRFINQFDPEGESIAKVYWSEDPEKLGDITKAPPVYKRVLGPDGKVTNRRVNAFQMKDDVLAAKVGGKTYYMQFADPKVGLALKKMTFGELGATMKMLRTVSNWQSLINTRANPAFVPINMLRDIQTGATLALSKDFKTTEIAKMVGSIPRAWGALWRDARGKPGDGKWDKIVADFKANGGKISFDQYNTIEDTAKKIQKELQRASTRGSASKIWRGFIDLIENLNDTIENGMRVAVFNAALEKGQTPKRAAFLARDLTVDFQKKGEITPHMNALYTFFNASVQGNTNFAKALYRSRKIKVAMGALVMAGYAQHVLNMALAGDDDDGENAYLKMLRNEPWTFERNIVLFLPGSKDYIKLPLGFGMNAFWHLGAQAGAVTTGDKGFLDATLDSTRVGFDAFNPLGSGGWVSMAMPSVIDPIWELGTNQNFSGNPIYPTENQFDQSPPPKSEQAFKSTSPIARWGAETLNKISGGSDKLPGAIDVYPDSLEYLWGWFTGGVGRFASQTVETAQRGVDLEFEPKKTPFIRSFYGSVDDQGKRSEYFAQRERVQFVKGKVKEFQEAEDEQGLKDFIADNKQDYDAIKAFDIAEKQRRRINKLRRKNEKRPDAADDLKALDEQELEIMNQARKAYFEAKPE